MKAFAWLMEAPAAARRALLAASLGWALDAFDVMLYSLVLADIIREFHLSKQTAGVLGSLTLLAAAAGGLFFGVIADRFGRTRALMASVFLYAVFTAACGFAHTLVALAVFRTLLGFGMGGEWASGAALVSDTWPERDRGKGAGADAIGVGGGVCGGGARCGGGAAAFWVARGVLYGDRAGAADAVHPA